MDLQTAQALARYMGQYITENKLGKIDAVLAERTNHLAVVLEDIYQPHNASAVVRTCDCMGVQNLHIIENEHAYELNPGVTMGSAKWISMHRYNKKGQFNTPACVERLRVDGYTLVATVLRPGAIAPHELPLDKKLAFFMGTEETGLTDYAIEQADVCLQLPMYGFTQSYNLSVTAAIILALTTDRLRRSDINWRLTEEERTFLKLEWYRQQLTNAEAVEKRFFEETGAK